jgi:hypothetical protein
MGAQTLPVKLHDHDQFPNSNHRIAPSSQGSSIGDSVSGARPGYARSGPGHATKWGNFGAHF